MIQWYVNANHGLRLDVTHYFFTEVQQEWEEQHKVVLEVVEKLQACGLQAKSASKFPSTYLNHYDELEQLEGHHYIEVNWS